MPKTLRVTSHLTADELVTRFLQCDSKDEKLRWQAVMLKAEGRRANDIADICKRREDWVRRTVRRYNELGPEGVADRRQNNGRDPILDDEKQTDLWEAIQGPAPDGGLWTAPKVAKWIAAHAGQKVDDHTGWLYLKRLGYTRQTPRPTHPEADEKAQEAFKRGGYRKPSIALLESIPGPRSRSGPRTKPASDGSLPTDASGRSRAGGRVRLPGAATSGATSSVSSARRRARRTTSSAPRCPRKR